MTQQIFRAGVFSFISVLIAFVVSVQCIVALPLQEFSFLFPNIKLLSLVLAFYALLHCLVWGFALQVSVRVEIADQFCSLTAIIVEHTSQ